MSRRFAGPAERVQCATSGGRRVIHPSFVARAVLREDVSPLCGALRMAFLMAMSDMPSLAS